jgi:PAS domain S-box-containing protein
MEIKTPTPEQNKITTLLDDLMLMESYARDLLSFLPLPVCLISLIGIVLEINPALEKISGYRTEEIIGNPLEKFLSKTDAKQLIKETIKNGSISSREIILTTKDKKKIYVSAATLLRKNEQGEIIGCFISLFDITAIKENEQELRESQNALLNMLEDVEEEKRKTEEEKDKTLAIIENIYTPIIFVDKNNKIALFNSAAQKFLGLKLSDLGKEISNKDNFNLNNFKPVIRNKIILHESKDNEPSNTKTEKLYINYNNEELVYKVITSRVIGENSEYLGVIKIFYDLTRETAIDKLKSEFVSIAAHQLRTPLSAIKWVIKMVLDGDAGKLNDEQFRLLSGGYKSNERIIRLVDDLLDVSRIEEGRFGYNFKYSDFQEVLTNVVENVASPIAKNHLKLSVDKPKKLPKIYMDSERITLVLQNLLDNAIKYTPEFGQIKIKIQTLDEDKILKVSIKDQGVGIPKADQPKLFLKFFRAVNAIRLETAGTGLGLFIAKNIIKKHNGEIGIKSEEGKGTEAYFSLPISKIIR